MAEGAGDRFQNQTKYLRNRMPGGYLDLDSRPGVYKTYSEAETTSLPSPEPPENLDFHNVVKTRKSERDFTDEPLSLQEVSYLLWASTGLSREEHGYEFRTAPSAGALYPIETYIASNNISDNTPGIYHYSVQDHKLELLNKGDMRQKTADAALGQGMCARAAVIFMWTAVFQRSKWKYGQRAYRYVYLDAGHIAAQLSLAAVSLGLGSCQIGALFDDEVNGLLGVDGKEESVLYMSAVGRPFSK
ncbi:MAG: SagB/ThcOx family dehydrogenase [Candidatus Omnitrophica bacterium]|nr:SagB/ThcOx family dehydrogenase [Candidatus Omnitrophota bacterium]